MAEEHAARIMLTIRVMLTLISATGVYLMYKNPTIEAGLKINSFIIIINPLLFLVLNMVGVAGLAGKVSFLKLGLILSGALLIFLGTITK
ncbi:hypothetical protein GGQ84_001772 [Desulfitispora alkaliphila]|uniref:DUF2619 domain-containing protein n=1 Tax=Desulfitispora alkaliphila TaxID=622674 RepID=UPI003D2000DA